MTDGSRVLQWAEQNQYSLEWIAKQIGYSHRALTQALNQDRITPNLAEALCKRFGLRVRPTTSPGDDDDNGFDDD